MDPLFGSSQGSGMIRLVFQLNSLERVEREQFALIEKLSAPARKQFLGPPKTT